MKAVLFGALAAALLAPEPVLGGVPVPETVAVPPPALSAVPQPRECTPMSPCAVVEPRGAPQADGKFRAERTRPLREAQGAVPRRAS